MHRNVLLLRNWKSMFGGSFFYWRFIGGVRPCSSNGCGLDLIHKRLLVHIIKSLEARNGVLNIPKTIFKRSRTFKNRKTMNTIQIILHGILPHRLDEFITHFPIFNREDISILNLLKQFASFIFVKCNIAFLLGNSHSDFLLNSYFYGYM